MNKLFPDSMQSSIPSLREYVSGILAWSLVIVVFSLIAGYEESFLLMHQSWGSFFDMIMPHLTHLADGAMIGGLLGIWYSEKKPVISLSLLFSLILVSVTIALLKSGVFPDWHRPATVLGEDQVRLLSLGQEKYRSFPSGHSAAAACLGWFICLLYPSRWWTLPTILIAIFLGWTRVYIGVHFPADVSAGLVVGLTCAAVGTGLANWMVSEKWNKSAIFSRLMLAVSLIFLILGILNTIDKYYLPA